MSLGSNQTDSRGSSKPLSASTPPTKLDLNSWVGAGQRGSLWLAKADEIAKTASVKPWSSPSAKNVFVLYHAASKNARTLSSKTSRRCCSDLPQSQLLGGTPSCSGSLLAWSSTTRPRGHFALASTSPSSGRRRATSCLRTGSARSRPIRGTRRLYANSSRTRWLRSISPAQGQSAQRSKPRSRACRMPPPLPSSRRRQNKQAASRRLGEKRGFLRPRTRRLLRLFRLQPDPPPKQLHRQTHKGSPQPPRLPAKKTLLRRVRSGQRFLHHGDPGDTSLSGSLRSSYIHCISTFSTNHVTL
jgi:hypothetical protein